MSYCGVGVLRLNGLNIVLTLILLRGIGVAKILLISIRRRGRSCTALGEGLWLRICSALRVTAILRICAVHVISVVVCGSGRCFCCGCRGRIACDCTRVRLHGNLRFCRRSALFIIFYERFYRICACKAAECGKNYVCAHKRCKACYGIYDYGREHPAERIMRETLPRRVVAIGYVAAVQFKRARGNRMKQQKESIHRERAQKNGNKLKLKLFFCHKPYAEVGKRGHYKKTAVAESAVHKVHMAFPKPAKIALPLKSASVTIKQNNSTVMPSVSRVKINEVLLSEFLFFTFETPYRRMFSLMPD